MDTNLAGNCAKTMLEEKAIGLWGAFGLRWRGTAVRGSWSAFVQWKEKSGSQGELGLKCELRHKQPRQPSPTNVRGLFRNQWKVHSRNSQVQRKLHSPNYRAHPLLPKEPFLNVEKAVDKCLWTAGVDGSGIKALTLFSLSRRQDTCTLDRDVLSTMRWTFNSILRKLPKRI